MSSSSHTVVLPPIGGAAPISDAPEWTLHEHSVVTSTNLVAATLPAWHAVRAGTQTAGRGRFQRHWVSDEGGLWLSAVVPVRSGSIQERLLPLMAGLAVCDALRSLGVEHLRLRWPNDILAPDKKLAGLLIDRFGAELAVVGMGINVLNCPEEFDPLLRGQVLRLADLVTPLPDLPQLARGLLASLRLVLDQTRTLGSDYLLPRLNELWHAPRPVRLELDADEAVTGAFEGIDPSGRLNVRLSSGRQVSFEPHQVRLLRDL